MQGLPFPSGVVSATTTTTTPTATAVAVPANAAEHKHSKKGEVASPIGRTCGLAHIVTNWTDTRSNDRVSVAMILPSGVNPSKRSNIQLRVSGDGMWLIVKVRVDTGLIDAYQCYHSYLTKEPYNIHPLALDYHGKVCSHKRIVTEWLNEQTSEEIWDEHQINLGKVCRRTLAAPGDGDTIFYGTTGVAPRKNGTQIYHVELIVEETAKRLTKKPKFGKSVDWYEHVEKDGDRVEVDEELEELANRRKFGDEMGSDDDSDDDSKNNNKNKNNNGKGMAVSPKTVENGAIGNKL